MFTKRQANYGIKEVIILKIRYRTFHYFYSFDLWLESNASSIPEAIEYLQNKYQVDDLHDSCVAEIYTGQESWNNKNEICISC